MGRRVDTGDNEVSLFPFLSILACIIGVLTLMISTLALSQMDNKAVAQVEEYEKLTKELEEKEKAVAELESQLKDAKQAIEKQDQLAQKQKQLEELLKQFSLATIKKAELDSQPNAGEVPVKQPIEELETELGSLKEQIAQLTVELEKKSLPPEEAEVTVLPGGSGTGIVPEFIECTKNQIVLHLKEGPIRVRINKISKDEDYVRLLDRVAGNPDAKVIFLVRDDGVHTWWRASQFANSLEVAHGKLPVLGHGKLNFHNFNNR